MELEKVPKHEIENRIEKMQGFLKKEDIQGALISQCVDLFYFTGTFQRGFLYIPKEGSPFFMVQKSYERALNESPLSNIVEIKNSRHLPKMISDRGFTLNQIGMEFDVIPTNLYLRYKFIFKESDLVDISELIKKVRVIKSTYEIKQFERAAKIVDRVISKAKDFLKPGITEIELDGKLIGIGRALGHQGILRMRGFNQEMINIYVLSGKNGAYPSFGNTPLGGPGPSPAMGHGSSLKQIEKGEPIIIDYGVAYNGYIIDQTRLFAIGKLNDDLIKAYEVTREIKRDMEEKTRPGDKCYDIYKRAIDIAKKRGYEENFMGFGNNRVRFVGHGLGLEINEPPFIAKGISMEIEPGMVFAFEPKIVFPNIGAVGVEDDYLVTDYGVKPLTITPDDIFYI